MRQFCPRATCVQGCPISPLAVLPLMVPFYLCRQTQRLKGVGWLLAALSLSSLPQLAWAQTVPPLAPDTLDPLPFDLLPPPADLLEIPETAPSSPEPETDATRTIIVRRFQVVGSTLFSDAELDAATAPYRDRPITFSDLLKARSAITQLYLDQGYLTSGAYLPADQTIQDGVVTLEVVEGSLEDIRISGNQSLKDRYIRDRIMQGGKPPLNIKRLVEALEMLDDDPLITTLSAELLPGREPGLSLLAVEVKEAQPWLGRVSLNNHRSAAYGDFTRSLTVSRANLLGIGDRLTVGYGNSDGSNDFNLSYAVPVNAQDGRLSLSYAQADSRVVLEPFSFLDIQSVTREGTLAFVQPIIYRPDEQLSLGIAFSRKESKSLFLGGFLLPDEGLTRISALSISQEWVRRNQRFLFAVRSEFDFGLDIAATRRASGPDGRFFKWQGQAQWIYAFHPDTTLSLSTSLQIANRPLPGQELLGLGGVGGVPGYPAGFFLFDNVFLTAAQAKIPLYRSTSNQHRLYFAPSMNLGYGWNAAGEPSSTGNRVLLSPGIGLHYEWSDRLGLTIDWGIPLVGLPGDNIAPGFGDSRITFSLDAVIF